MTNAEKYLKDGVDEKDFLCDYMDFKKDSGLGFDINSLGLFLQAQVKPLLTEDERVILKNIDQKYKFIGKNDKNFLYIRISVDNGNFVERLTGLDFVFPNLFQFIKNGEEYEIEELLKGE